MTSSSHSRTQGRGSKGGTVVECTHWYHGTEELQKRTVSFQINYDDLRVSLVSALCLASIIGVNVTRWLTVLLETDSRDHGESRPSTGSLRMTVEKCLLPRPDVPRIQVLVYRHLSEPRFGSGSPVRGRGRPEWTRRPRVYPWQPVRDVFPV